MTTKTATFRTGTFGTFLMMFLIMLSLGVKAILPVGFMPTTNADGTVEIVICSGAGDKVITVPADQAPNEKPASHDKTDINKACSFQTLLSGKIFNVPPVAVIGDRDVIRDIVTVTLQERIDSAHPLPFAARGPPAA